MRSTTSLLLAAACLVAALTLTVDASGFYDKKSSGVINITPDNYDKFLASDKLWLVEFYAPWCGHCKRLTPEWIKTAKALKDDDIKIAALDADQHKELASKYGITGFPTINVFGADKTKEPKQYSGARDAANLVKFAKNEKRRMNGEEVEEEPEPTPTPPPAGGGMFANTDVVELNDENFEQEVIQGKEPFLVEFYAPWCGHCKTLAPEWKKAATELLGTFKIASVDATISKDVASKYGITGFPTIKFFAPGGEGEPVDYNGGRTAEGIVEYAMQKAEAYPSLVPAVQQIENQAALQANCLQKQLCLVFVLPHVIDTGAEGRNAMVTMAGEVMKKLRAKGVQGGWVVGGEHVGFEESLGIHTNYPTVVAISEKKMRFANYHGAFTADAIVGNMKKVMSGKVGTSVMKEVPKMSKNVPMWDGKDYTEPEEEEDEY